MFPDVGIEKFGMGQDYAADVVVVSLEIPCRVSLKEKRKKRPPTLAPGAETSMCLLKRGFFPRGFLTFVPLMIICPLSPPAYSINNATAMAANRPKALDPILPGAALAIAIGDPVENPDE